MSKITGSQLGLYLVLETDMLKIPLPEFIRQVSEAGVTTIQLRDKEASAAEKLQRAFIINDNLLNCPLSGKKPLFIINDRADIAAFCGADGVHVGIKDIHPKYIKEVFPNLIIGYSCNNLSDAETASLWADYAGIGPFFPTATKKDLRSLIGPSGAAKIVNALSIPSVGIGGINLQNINEALSSGVSGAAISSYICTAKEPFECVKELFGAIHEGI